MAAGEAKLPAGERIDFVSIVIPNHLHFPVAKTFLETGFNVVCDKPMTFDLDEALELRSLVKRSGKVFALSYNYTGYPMVKEAREIVRRGELGKILKVVTEYPQRLAVKPTRGKGPGTSVAKRSCQGWSPWLSRRYRPPTLNTLRVMSPGLKSTSYVLTSPNSVPDNDSGRCEYSRPLQWGARGIIHCSKISAGEENRLNIRAYGYSRLARVGSRASKRTHRQIP